MEKIRTAKVAQIQIQVKLVKEGSWVLPIYPNIAWENQIHQYQLLISHSRL